MGKVMTMITIETDTKAETLVALDQIISDIEEGKEKSKFDTDNIMYKCIVIGLEKEEDK